jgi:ketosteroid isomerase-like protein
MLGTEEFLSEWAAAEASGNAQALQTLLADGFIAIGPMGFILPKVAWIGRHSSGDLTYQDFSLEEVEARPVGQDAAVVTARNNTRGSYRGHPIPEATRATLVLASGAGRWQLAAIHMSFIAGTAGAPPLPGQAGK